MTSLKDTGRMLKALFTTTRIGSRPFRTFAVTACAVKFVLYVLSQTVVPAGTPISSRLSLDGDLLCLTVALLAMCRARDAKVRGLFGFLGCLISFFGIGALLVFAFRGAGIAIDRVTVNVIAVVPQVTQLMFVWWMATRPSAPSPQFGPA